MRQFMDKDFLLETDTARKLFHEVARKQEIIDFHNHLNPEEILNDKKYKNLTEVWLGGDHYKWRAMRVNGVPEELITGDGDPYDKFLAWADTIQNAIGNPLYHWTHLELQRYFGIDIPLSLKTAEQIWKSCNEKLNSQEYTARNLLKMQNVEVLCTTDDPVDSLDIHEQIKDSELTIKVLPTFRPDKIMGINKIGFCDYVKKLGEVCNTTLHTIDDVMKALENRLDYFIKRGCKVSDHSLEYHFFEPATKEQINIIFEDALNGKQLDSKEIAMYEGYLLGELGKLYAMKGIVMQVHIGAIRNNSTRMQRQIGDNTGFDSMHDFCMAQDLSCVLNSMDIENIVPKMILYNLNPKDAEMFSTMACNFAGNEQGIKGKVQLGISWWFNDHKVGIQQQMEVIAHSGLLSTFLGMLTDSRSFLSFPRHEYFRRILCNMVGNWVETGEYPNDMDYLTQMIEGICGENAKRFFEF